MLQKTVSTGRARRIPLASRDGELIPSWFWLKSRLAMHRYMLPYGRQPFTYENSPDSGRRQQVWEPAQGLAVL